MTRPWLSVVMPTYNGQSFLAMALASIRAQNDRGIEIVAVDDGSTDNTLLLLREFARSFPLRIIQRQHAGNWVTNTNVGLREIQSEFACFLHQDDAWLPGRLDALRVAVNESSDIRFWIHACRFIDPKGRTLGKWTCPLPDSESGIAATTVLERLLVQNWIGIPAPLFRREDALAVGGLDESLWYTADWDFWLKLAALGRTRYWPRPLACFRIHPFSQTVTRGRAPGAIQQQCRLVQERHFPLWNSSPCRKRLVRAVGELATSLNGNFAERLSGSRLPWRGLLSKFWRLGPEGWWRFGRDSRLMERLRARIRAGLGRGLNSE